ncbi:MAG TPA: ATP-binding protein [Symbiobacteriaceae bacterium]|nr:ATP-binding protein [Symbiobacteriaceae bacterium]
MQSAADAMFAEGRLQKRMVVTADGRLQIYALPISDGHGVMLVWDLSRFDGFLQQCQMSITHIYRDVVYSATGGRMILVPDCEIPEWVGQPEQRWVHPVREPGDVPLCRRLVTEQMNAAGGDRRQTAEMALCVSEAVTNALKHAGGGDFELIKTTDSWVAKVRDYGSGLDRSLLPLATLLPGFSTKPSLGLGFTAMLKCMDRVVLASSPKGVTILLVKLICPPPSA